MLAETDHLHPDIYRFLFGFGWYCHLNFLVHVQSAPRDEVNARVVDILQVRILIAASLAAVQMNAKP